MEVSTSEDGLEEVGFNEMVEVAEQKDVTKTEKEQRTPNSIYMEKRGRLVFQRG